MLVRPTRTSLGVTRWLEDVEMNMQEVRIVANLHILLSVGLDMVFGNTRLKSIGRVLINFKNMTMEFKLGGKKKT